MQSQFKLIIFLLVLSKNYHPVNSSLCPIVENVVFFQGGRGGGGCMYVFN